MIANESDGSGAAPSWRHQGAESTLRLAVSCDAISKLSEKFSRFASAEAIASIGALQLMPENAGHAARLELAACAVVAAHCGSSPRSVSRGSLDGLVNGLELSHPFLVSQEDPIGGWFVEAFTFVGGAYLVLPGITSDATFILRHLGMAIALYKMPFRDADYATQAKKLFQVVLGISDAIARRAGLGRGVLPVQQPGHGRIDVPTAARLAALREAVTFTKADMAKILDRCGGELELLRPFITQVGAVQSKDCTSETNPLQASPLVEVDEQFIVANPLGLLAALRHHVICRAKHASVTDELAARMCSAAMPTTKDSLRLMNVRFAGSVREDTPPILLMAHGLFGFDTDKALYTCVLSDDLQDYDEKMVFGYRKKGDSWPALRTHLDRVCRGLFSCPEPPNEIFVLILSNPLGQIESIGIGERGDRLPYELEAMSVSDLEILSHLEQGKNLFLWKFARASQSFRDKVDLFCIGILNEYGCFRDRDYSFYLSDKGRPDYVTLDASWEGPLYRESLERIDPQDDKFLSLRLEQTN